MKRNNMFMWAYITFIFIALIVRIFCNYALWNSIVLAIATSGIFFAVEDFFSSLSNASSGSIEVLEKMSNGLKEKSKKESQAYTELIKELSEKNSDHTDKIKSCAKKLAECVKEALEYSEKNIEKSKKREKKTKLFANVFAFIGFLCLLTVMIFTSFFEIPTLLQDILTVLPFAVILITQQFNNKFVEDHKEETDSVIRLFDNYDNLIETLYDANKKFKAVPKQTGSKGKAGNSAEQN